MREEGQTMKTIKENGIDDLKFDSQGLIPAVVTDYYT